jgi:hypothetical protein
MSESTHARDNENVIRELRCGSGQMRVFGLVDKRRTLAILAMLI